MTIDLTVIEYEVFHEHLMVLIDDGDSYSWKKIRIEDFLFWFKDSDHDNYKICQRRTKYDYTHSKGGQVEFRMVFDFTVLSSEFDSYNVIADYFKEN